MRSRTPQPPSSIGGEIAWLLFFLAIFAVAVYLLGRLLVPHHFNVTVSIMLAAIAAGLVTIVLRGWAAAKWRRG